MKNRIIFFTTLVTTVFFGCIGILWLLNSNNKPKKTYSIDSYIRLENKKGVITNSCLNITDCLNQKDMLEFKISAGTNEKRNVKYELSFFADYEQIPFVAKNTNVTSFLFSNDINMTVELKNNFFDKKYNSFVIILRQDISHYTENNDLISEIPPVIMRYTIIRKDGTANSENEMNVDITEQSIDNKEELVSIEKQAGDTKGFHHIKGEKTVKLNAILNSKFKSGKYAFFALYDSQQAKINNQNKLFFTKKNNGKLNFEVSVPKQKGKYEFQVFFVPAPYQRIEDSNFQKYDVISSQKYTVHVE